MKRRIKKALAVLLAITIMSGTVDMSVFAQEANIQEQITTEETSTELQTSTGESDSVTQQETEISSVEESQVMEDTTIDQSQTESMEETSQLSTAETMVQEVSLVQEEETNVSNWDGVTKQTVFNGDNYKVTFILDGYWEGGYLVKVKIENIGDSIIENWYINFDFINTVSNVWNAEISSVEGNSYLLKNVSYNQDIPAYGSVEFGFGANENFAGFPTECVLLGEETETNEENYTVDYRLDRDWGDGFTGTITITNNSEQAIEDWRLEFDFERNITGIWNGAIESHEGSHYVIKNAGYNADIAPGQSISFGFSGSNGSAQNNPQNFCLYSYELYNGDSMELDTDGDGIVDGNETLWGLDYKKADSDDDGLTDFQELYLTLTDPLSEDTDSDGVIDSEDDSDEDGLDNKFEIDLGTDAILVDTDGDGLLDYEEIYSYQTDPLLPDTDGDSLTDYDDVFLGFSPLLADTNSNGVMDCNEKIEQTIQSKFNNNEGKGILEVSVSLNVDGNLQKNLVIDNIYGEDALSSNVVGLVGIPVEINTNKEFETAEIVFHYDENAIGNTKEEDLAILWYDEENGLYKILDEDSIVDTEKNTVSYTTTHFSTYMLVDSDMWYNAWRENINYRISTSGEETQYFDIVFVVDVSGSMKGERISTAKEALKEFTNTLQTGDRGAVVKFNGTASMVCNFTDNKETLNESFDNLKASGGTNVNNGLRKALEIFEQDSSNNQKIVILLCDGDVNYVQSTIDSYVEKNIQIYSINVENESSHNSLEKMSQLTGGEYYYGTTIEFIDTIFSFIETETINQLDKTDTDGDGLYDVYEIAGMKLPNGKIVYTDPYKEDTDGDSLSDYDEIGIPYNCDDWYIGNSTYYSFIMFRLKSDPTKKDTDNDGLYDDKDPWPAYGHTFESLSNFRDREEWGASELDYADSSLEKIDIPEEYYDTIVVHHTARNQYENIKKLEKNMIGDGYNGIAYHYVIDGNGIIYEGRPIHYKGAHVKDNNTGKIGVTLMGNFHPDADDIKQWFKDAMPTEPTYVQYKSLLNLIQVLDTQYGTDYLGGHRDFVVSETNTVCPGDTFYSMLVEEGIIELP